MNMTNKVKNILLYTGSIGAIISAIAYIIITVVLVMGFETQMEMDKQILFSIIGAVDGLLITLLLRSQGIALAKNEDESKKVMAEYYQAINKTKKSKKLHTITYYYVKDFIIDIFTKAGIIALTTSLMLYIFMDGSGDYGLIGLAISNILMFACFGIIALSKFYSLYIEQHIPVIKERIIRIKDELASVQAKEKVNADLRNNQVLITSTTSEQEQERHRNVATKSSGHLELNS